MIQTYWLANPGEPYTTNGASIKISVGPFESPRLGRDVLVQQSDVATSFYTNVLLYYLPIFIIERECHEIRKVVILLHQAR